MVNQGLVWFLTRSREQGMCYNTKVWVVVRTSTCWNTVTASSVNETVDIATTPSPLMTSYGALADFFIVVLRCLHIMAHFPLTYCTHSKSGCKENLKFDLTSLSFSWLVVWAQRALPQAAVEGSAGGSSAEVYAVPSAVEEHWKEGLFWGRGEHTTEHCGPSRHSHMYVFFTSTWI